MGEISDGLVLIVKYQRNFSIVCALTFTEFQEFSFLAAYILKDEC